MGVVNLGFSGGATSGGLLDDDPPFGTYGGLLDSDPPEDMEQSPRDGLSGSFAPLPTAPNPDGGGLDGNDPADPPPQQISAADSNSAGGSQIEPPAKTAMPPDLGISPAGIKAIEGSEILRNQPYLDSSGHWTIGYGHKITKDDPQFTYISGDDADKLMAKDLQTAVNAVKSKVHVPLTQGQMDALTSLVYNVGANGIDKTKMLDNLNQGNYVGAATEMLTFDHAGGKVSNGLTTRRRGEAEMFLGPDAGLLPAGRPPGA